MILKHVEIKNFRQYKNIDQSFIPYYNDKNIGVTNVGGVSINANLIFANGTSDNYAFVFRANDGKELWKYKMPAAGTAPPLIYEYNNKQYVSFLSTGGIDSDSERNSVLLTFSIN